MALYTASRHHVATATIFSSLFSSLYITPPPNPSWWLATVCSDAGGYDPPRREFLTLAPLEGGRVATLGQGGAWGGGGEQEDKGSFFFLCLFVLPLDWDYLWWLEERMRMH